MTKNDISDTLRTHSGGGGGGSSVKFTDCSSGGPRVNSQQPLGSSQPPVTPVPGDLLPPSDLLGHKTCIVQTDAQAKKVYIKNKISKPINKLKSRLCQRDRQTDRGCGESCLGG